MIEGHMYYLLHYIIICDCLWEKFPVGSHIYNVVYENGLTGWANWLSKEV